ncbi:hypothetical protein JCM10212_000050 [Sporobolomyces blumeae]
MYQSSLTSSSRGPSLDQARGGSFDRFRSSPSTSPPSHAARDGAHAGGSGGESSSSIYSDPFREPSIEYTRSSQSGSDPRSGSASRAGSIVSARSSLSSSRGATGQLPWSPLTSENGDHSDDYTSSTSPPPPARLDQASSRPTRPGLPTSDSDLSRQIDAALNDDLPPVRERSSTLTNGSAATKTRKRSESGATLKARNGKDKDATNSPSFLQQFRSGSGWFSPLVEPEPALTREEVAQREKERIERLKSAPMTAKRRPGLMKRLSSGLELSGFGGGGSGGGGGSNSPRR